MKSNHFLRIALLVVIAFSCQSCTNEREVSPLKFDFEKALEGPIDSLAYYAEIIHSKAINNNDSMGVALSQTLSGFYYWQHFATDTARTLLESAKYFFNNSQFQNSLDHGRVLLYLSFVELRNENIIEARNYSIKALKIFEDLDNKRYTIKSLSLLGGIAKGLNDYSQALAYYHDALEMQNNYPEDPELERTILINLSQTYSAMNEQKRALKYAFQALELEKSYKNSDSEVNILNTIGIIYSSMKNLDSAIYYYSQSINLSSEIGNGFMENIAYYNIANTYSNFGRIDITDSIIANHLNPVFNLSDGASARLYILKAKNHLKKNEPDSAIKKAYYGYIISKANGLKQSEANSSKILWEGYEKLYQFDSALKYSKNYFILSDSISSRKNERLAVDLRIAIETLDKQIEIDQLEIGNQLAESRFQKLVISTSSITIIIVLLSISYRSHQRSVSSQLHFENMKLAKELEKNKVLLSNQTLNMIRKNIDLEEIESQLVNIEGKGKTRIINIIKRNRALQKDWGNFNNYFSQVHVNFFSELVKRHPNLSIQEKRLAALIKLNLSNTEMSSLLSIETKSIVMYKYRLKKKLEIDENENIDDYIVKLDTT